MRISRWLMLFVPLIAMETASADPPKTYTLNASSIGMGGVGRNISWPAEAQQQPVWCYNACRYLVVSTAKIAPDSGTAFKDITWPNNSTTVFPNPVAIVRSTATPTDQVDSNNRPIIHNSTTYERAAVDHFRDGSESMSAKVYQSGNQPTGQNGTAAAALAYHVRVQNQSSDYRDFFVRFNAPKSLQNKSPAYNSFGGPSQTEPTYIREKYAKSRSIVDVLVNGLPVWSTTSNYFYPEDYYGDPNGGFTTDWGYDSDNDQYLIFVGRFPSGDTFSLDFIVRADAVARAPTCGKDSEPMTYPNPRVLMHCFVIGEGRTLPEASSDARFEVYSKTVSTPIYQYVPSGPLPIGPASVSASVMEKQ